MTGSALHTGGSVVITGGAGFHIGGSALHASGAEVPTGGLALEVSLCAMQPNSRPARVSGGGVQAVTAEPQARRQSRNADDVFVGHSASCE